jgi:uridine kinase
VAADLGSLLRSAPARAGRTKFIGIDGRGAAGKSTLAALLSRAFAARVVHTDDFASWDSPSNWPAKLIASVLEPIANGATAITYAPTVWWSNEEPTTVEQPVAQVLILEGVSALRREFRPYLSVGIFIEISREVSIDRGIARDLATGQPRDDLQRLWNGWADEEDNYFARDEPWRVADIVLDGTLPFAGQLTP